MRYVPFSAAVLAVAACQGPTSPVTVPDESENKAERVMSGCGEAARLLSQMKAAESSFNYDSAGNATIDESLWNSLPDQMKDGLVKAIAYYALCEADALGDQEVTVRSAQDSGILAQETVADFGR